MKQWNNISDLLPMYSFGKWWKWKISLIGFVYRVGWVLKALWIFLSETINFLRKLHNTKIFGMYIAPSSGHISLNFDMPFKLILRRFEVVFWCLEWECCSFLKDWWKFIQIHQYFGFNLAGICPLLRIYTSLVLLHDRTEEVTLAIARMNI